MNEKICVNSRRTRKAGTCVARSVESSAVSAWMMAVQWLLSAWELGPEEGVWGPVSGLPDVAAAF